MTTINDDLEDRISTLGPVVLEQGRDRSLTGDPTGTYPKFPDWYSSSLPKTSYGAELTALNLGGGLNGIDVTSGTPSNSMNTRNRVIKTASGHTFEMDDTPGNERIILGHNSGNGIEFKSDGSMVIVSGSQTIQVSSDQKIIIEGNVTIAYGGNVDMEVAGDFNLKIGGSYNVEVGENKNESISGSWRSTTEGNVGHIVKGNSSATTLGTSTSTVLGDNNNVTKGASRITSEGDMRLSSGATSYISSKGKMFQSSNNMNIAASDLSVFGATGTIGGEGIHVYAKNVHAQKTVYGQTMQADTFYGDLEGTARDAQEAGTAGGIGGVSIGSLTTTARDVSSTALPDTATLNQYLNQTQLGAVDVKVDIGDHLLRSLNRSSATSGISTKDLKTTEVRSFMRSESVRNDPLFISNAVSTGTLSPTYSQNTPKPVSRVNSSNQEPFRGSTSLGTRGPNGDQKFIAPDIKTFNFVPDSKISNSDNITLGTQIIKSVPLSTFTGGKGSIGRLSEIPIASRAQIARNLQPHAELLKRIRSNRDSAFRENRLVVIEGLYKPRDIELNSSDWSTSVNRYKSEGRAVVYELHNTQGKADLEKTYDLAVHLKTVGSFQKLILDYDTYNPDGSLNVQLIVVTPALSESYTVTDGNWSKEVVTLYNNAPLSNTDLIEMKPED